jgi:group II intron reverse transcriptase/maturase
MINVAKRMKHWHTLAQRDPGKRFTDLWRAMTSVEWLTQAWAEIRTNTGSRTPGVDGHTGEDVDPARIEQLSVRLRAGTYRPKPVRRVYIPKSNGRKRSLGILTIEDRLVQQAVRMVLEPIFEADFLPCAHGFRQGHSPLTALRHVARMYPRVSWIIEADITACFDNLSRRHIMTSLQRRIADGKILSLVARFLEVGYMEDWQYHRTYSGVAQGGILSPLLSNIALLHLDRYLVQDLGANRPQTPVEERRRRNPTIQKLDHAIARARRKLRRRVKRPHRRMILDHLTRLEQQRKRLPRFVRPHPTKLGYVRYADDLVVLVNGTKAEALAVKEQLKTQLAAIGLELNEEKTKLTHWSKPVAFLGYHLQGQLRARGTSLKATLHIPRQKEHAFCQELRKTTRYHQIPELDLMLLLNSKFRGWCHYYRYANNPQPTFSRLSHKLWWDYAHYRARHDRTSIRQMLIRAKRAGQYKVIQKGSASRATFVTKVGKKEYILDCFPPKTGQLYAMPTHGAWTVDLKPIAMQSWLDGRSAATRCTARSRSAGLCERCGQQPAQQIHHRSRLHQKRLQQSKIESDRSQQRSAVALCKECHLSMHQRTYRPK